MFCDFVERVCERFSCIVKGNLLGFVHSPIAIILMPHTTKAIPSGSFQDNFSLRNLVYVLLRCGAAATIVVATAFLVWSLPQALTWLQQYLALYAMTFSVDTAWVLMVLQPALVFSGALLVWTIDEVLQAWQQEPVVELAKAQFSVVSPDFFGAKGSVDSYGGTQKNVHFSQKLTSYFTPEKPLSATNNSQFPVEEIEDQNESSPWLYLFDYKNNHAQDLHSGYDGMTNRVNRRLTPVFDDCAKSSAFVQKTGIASGKVIKRQSFNQWPGSTKYRHRRLEEWIQSGILSYSQRVKAYQLWLSSVPVPRSYLNVPEDVGGVDMLVGDKPDEFKLLIQQDEGSLENYKPIDRPDCPQCDSLDGATSPEATSSLGSADETDDAYSGNDKDTSIADTSWAARILSLFSPSAKSASTGYNEQVTPLEKPFTTTPAPSGKDSPSSVSFYDGLRKAMRSLDNILGGASSDKSTPVSPDSQKFKREKPSYGTFSLHSPSLGQLVQKLEYNSTPFISQKMDRSPLPSSALENVSVNYEDDLFSGAMLGSPISFSKSPSVSLNQDGSPFSNVAFTTFFNMSVAKQYHHDLSSNEDIIGGSRLLGQQDESRDEIDGLAVNLDALRLQHGQTTSPVMLGNDSQKPVDSCRETDRVESSLDDIDDVLGGGCYTEDHRDGDIQSTRFDSPSASESQDNSIWVDRTSIYGNGQ